LFPSLNLLSVNVRLYEDAFSRAKKKSVISSGADNGFFFLGRLSQAIINPMPGSGQ
jgi:hypothetical protein